MADSPSRSTKLIVSLVVGIGTALLVGTLVYFNLQAFQSLDQLDPDSSSSIRTQAKVEKRSGGPQGYKASKTRITYTYRSAQGETFTQQEEVDGYLFNALEDQDSITICYDVDQPERSIIPGNESSSIGLVQVLVFDVLMLIVVLVVFLRYRKLKKAA